MQRLLQDRVFQTMSVSIVLCILIFAGVIGYQHWRFVQRAYAEAARFGYTEENFLVAEEHCGDPWILFIPPQTCYLTIYFTTDLTWDQLVQLMQENQVFGPSGLVRNGSSVQDRTLAGNINTYTSKRFMINDSMGSFTNLPVLGTEEWLVSYDKNRLSIKYWSINQKLTYTIDKKKIQQNIIGIGLRR